MTMKELFKKVDTYNEVAELMRTDKAEICFTYAFLSYEKFTNYNDFRKFIRRELVKEQADVILKSDAFEFDKDVEYKWTDSFGTTWDCTYCAELVSR